MQTSAHSGLGWIYNSENFSWHNACEQLLPNFIMNSWQRQLPE